MISETKLDETFSIVLFYLYGFCNSYRFYCHRTGGGIILQVREDIPSRLIDRKLPNNIEHFFKEINLRKKIVFCCSYNDHKNSISNHVDLLRKELNFHSSNC